MNIHGSGMTSQRARDRLIPLLQEQGIRDMMVLTAIRQTPRHLFVDEALASRAYENNALPIEAGQTISQPYIVARMTELLMANAPRKVLEVGTGSGYQAAVLAQLIPDVYTIERIERLHQKAQAVFDELALENIHTRLGDGWQGWSEEAPFDGILVTAAPDEVPQALLDQLRVGGQLIIPVGPMRGHQRLQRIVRTEDDFETEFFDDVVFVPLVQGEEG